MLTRNQWHGSWLVSKVMFSITIKGITLFVENLGQKSLIRRIIIDKGLRCPWQTGFWFGFISELW